MAALFLDIEPFDSDIQRLFLDLALARGRRGEAVRRYELYRTRIEKTFGTTPDFELRDLPHAAMSCRA